MESGKLTDPDLKTLVDSLEWYHTIDLGNGIVTQGYYDHRRFLEHYRFPDDLAGKTMLDIGAASGFFSFEFERRGAQVTATDLPAWFDHDFSPIYQPDKTEKTGEIYLHQPFQIAKHALGSNVDMKYTTIYNITPDTLGMFDLVFCGSVLLHLTDPQKALWNIARVTREKAIIATVITRQNSDEVKAEFVGHRGGDTWWIPTRACLQLMAVCAGFAGIEWISEFEMESYGRGSSYHGVMHCYKTTENWTSGTLSREQVIAQYANGSDEASTLKAQIETLQAQIRTYENRCETLSREQALAKSATNSDETSALKTQVELLNAHIQAYERRRAVRLANWLGRQYNRLISGRK